MTVISLADFADDTVRVKKGTVLMRQDEIGQCAYFVVKGRLLIEREMNGENVVLGEVHRMDIVGEIAILDDAPRSATVTAIEDSILITLDKSRIKTLIRRAPHFAEVILKLLCYKLRKIHDRLMQDNDLSQPECWLKICALLRLCAQNNSDPKLIYISFIDNLRLFNGISFSRSKEILNRLEKASLLKMDEYQSLSVDLPQINKFIEYCTEEFFNVAYPSPTPLKLSEIAQCLFNRIRQSKSEDNTIALSKAELLKLLITTNLWKSLRPSMQKQRAASAIQHMITNSIIELQEDLKDQFIISRANLLKIKGPEEEALEYVKLKTTLFSAPK